MSKALKKAGFKFVGPTTCYSLMQVRLLTIRQLHWTSVGRPKELYVLGCTPSCDDDDGRKL